MDYSDVIVFKYRTYDCPALGQRRFQGWGCDLNGNGRQELILEYGYLKFVSIRIMEFDGGAFRDLLDFMKMGTKVLDADAETGTLFLEREVWDRDALQYRKIRTKAAWNAAVGLYEKPRQKPAGRLVVGASVQCGITIEQLGNAQIYGLLEDEKLKRFMHDYEERIVNE